MTLAHYENSAGDLIESLPDEQKTQLAQIGKSIVDVTHGLEAIDRIERMISRDSSYLNKLNPPYYEGFKPESGKLFALVFTQPLEATLFSPYDVDNGCRSGVSHHKRNFKLDIKSGKPVVFLAQSIFPFAKNAYGKIINGYQYNGVGHGAPSITLEPNFRTGSVDGVTLGQVNYQQALKLLSGEAVIAGFVPEEIADQVEEIRRLQARQFQDGSRL